ncbi:MAG: hypothetical protein KAI55_02220 [Candidatus Aenigmarchaeota archaeon]|nr:hypothetical protein [Candidatus Aenigmarchaeota archaeon]
MTPENTLVILLLLLVILLYTYIKQPWRKGYLYVKENGKLMKGRSYSPNKYASRKKGEYRIQEDKQNRPVEDSKEQNNEEGPSKFDFLFKKEKEE